MDPSGRSIKLGIVGVLWFFLFLVGSAQADVRQERVEKVKAALARRPFNPYNLRNLLMLPDGSMLKVGFFTGEFAPFHEGHRNVAETALKSAGLDLVIVVPTPFATNDPKTGFFDAVEWGERIEFARIGTQGNSGLTVFPGPHDGLRFDVPHYLAGILSHLDAMAYPQKLTHIAGGDSLWRIVERGLLTRDPRPRVIVTRPGVQIPLEAQSHPNVQITENPVGRPISATTIMTKLAAGETPADVHPDVIKYLLTLPRYKKIITNYRVRRGTLLRALERFKERPVKESRVYLFDPQLNPGGHWTGETDLPVDAHREVLRWIKAQGDVAELKVLMIQGNQTDEKFEEVKKRWRDMVRYWIGLKKVTFLEMESRKFNVDVIVLHAPVGLSDFEEGDLSKHFDKGRQVVLYETADAPLSPIMAEGVGRGLTVISGSDMPERCRIMLRKVRR